MLPPTHTQKIRRSLTFLFIAVCIVVGQFIVRSFNAGEVVNFADYGDVHVPAATLKKFLRELQEPLMTYDLFEPITRLHCKFFIF